MQTENHQPHTEQELLTRQEAAKYLGVSYDTLALWACRKRYNLAYIKVGSLVRYRRADLDAFLEANRHSEDNTDGR